MHRVRWAGLEIKAKIPIACGFAFGMNQQSADSNDVCCLCRPKQGVSQQGLANALVLMRVVDG